MSKQRQIRQAQLIQTKRGKRKIKIVFRPFNWPDVQVMRSLPPPRKMENDNGFKYWVTELSIKAIEMLNDAGFALDENLVNFYRQSFINYDNIDSNSIGDPYLDGKMRHFQKFGTNFIKEAGGNALIALPMGSGKSLCSLGYVKVNPHLRPVLIIVPASLKLNWKQEIHKWLENPDIEILGGTKPYKPTGQIIIINYDIIAPRYKKVKNEYGEEEYQQVPGTGWTEMLKQVNPQLIIMDEVVKVKNSKSNRTQAIMKFVDKIPQKILLTGTPIENRPVEIWNAINILNPNLFPSKRYFDVQFCNAYADRFGWNNKGASQTKKLNKILKNTLMYRRKKEEILPELPPKVTSFIPIEINNWKEYKEAEKDFIEYVRKRKGDKEANRKANAEYLARLEGLKQIAVKGKFKESLNWINDMLEVTDKLIIFATHKFVLDWLMKEYDKKAVRIDGSVNTNIRKDGSSDRMDIVNRFRNDDNIKLLATNFQAGGEGLNLEVASNVIHLELTWSASTHDQAVDRAHRMTQTHQVNEYFLTAIGTIEDYIAEIIDNKRKIGSEIIDGESPADSTMLAKLIEKYKKNEK